VRIPSLLLLLLCSGNAAELLRDIHTDTAYIFDSDAKDVAVRIGREDALLRADEWATGFYGDALLEFVTCQFKTQPIRHWLIVFQKTETGQEYFAVVLPDGSIVTPSVERGLNAPLPSSSIGDTIILDAGTSTLADCRYCFCQAIWGGRRGKSLLSMSRDCC
jgi:hypothetical protein